MIHGYGVNARVFLPLLGITEFAMEVFFPHNTFFIQVNSLIHFSWNLHKHLAFLALPLAAESAACFGMINNFFTIQRN